MNLVAKIKLCFSSCFERFMLLIGFDKIVSASKRTSRWKRRRHVPQPATAPVVVNQKAIQYLLNDMTTPNLVKSVPPPTIMQYPKFTVVKYKGGGFPRGSVEARAANGHVTIANVINFYNKHTSHKITKWAGTHNLIVNPSAGKDINAFYNRASMQFFYYDGMFTIDSSDIVAHELGHAILDSYRPDTWGATSLEVWSFHEAFADVTAMLNIMSHDEILHYALNQTNGNMRKPSVISNLAEHVGQAVYKLAGPNSGRHPQYLRSTINNFKYVNPGTLPKATTHNKLAAECHSFGRVFLGAFYDILMMIYEDTITKGHPRINALKHARDVLANNILMAIQKAPLNTKFYESVAKTMLWAEKVGVNGGMYHDKMRQIFFDRNLMRPEVRMLSAPECTNDEHIMQIQSKMNIKLGDHILRSQSDNPLYNVEIEIPYEQVYLYDENNNIYDSVLVSQEEALSDAQDAIIYLHETGSVGEGTDTSFEIQRGKLCRTHFV